MTFIRKSFCLLLTSAFAYGVPDMTLRAQDGAMRIPDPVIEQPHKSVTVNNSIFGPSKKVLFSHGFFLQLRQLTTAITDANVALYNSKGALTNKLSIWPTGASRVKLTSVDINLYKQMAIAGSALRANGSGVGFVAIMQSPDSTPIFFDTGDYRANLITLAQDGSVWTLGAEKTEVQGTTKAWKNYDTLRHYGANGILLEHFLPRWANSIDHVTSSGDDNAHRALIAYDSNGNALPNYSSASLSSQAGYGGPLNENRQVWLRATSNGVVLYDGQRSTVFRYVASQAALLELHANFTIVPSPIFDGLVVSDEGRIFATASNIAVTGGPDNIYELQLHSSASDAVWTRLQFKELASSTSLNPVHLIGCDNKDLIYAARDGQVYWSALENK